MGKQWPLIIFLHGKGERGSNPEILLTTTLIKRIVKDTLFPFFVIAPQCPQRTYWDREKPSENIKKLIEELASSYNIDINRIYLTGYSMGGFGTWYTATKFPDLFAALAPVCGKGEPDKASLISHIPAWVFHGENDKIVPISGSINMVNALIKSGNNNVKSTFFPKIGHNCWDLTYSNPELYQWFLCHSKSEKK
jgi:predicted peptidase